MKPFRKWALLALMLILPAVCLSILLATPTRSRGADDWLMWWLLTTPFYAFGPSGKSRPCRRPRWLGGR